MVSVSARNRIEGRRTGHAERFASEGFVMQAFYVSLGQWLAAGFAG